MAVSTAVRGRMGRRLATFLFLFAVAWPWPIAAAFGLDTYTQTMALYLSACSTVALSGGVVWGLVARQVVVGTVASIIVVSVPLLVGTAYVLERQRVPNAVCATQVVFRIGTIQLAVPRIFGAFSAESDAEPAQAWEGSYSEWTGAKPDVRALCHVTDNGHIPIEAAHLWLSFNSYAKELQTVCDSSTVSSSLTDACAAQTRMTPTVVQFYADPDDIPVRSNSYFSERMVNDARSNGELEGLHCEDRKTGPDTRHCTLWYPLSSDVLVVSSAKLGPPQESEDPLEDTKVLVDALVQRLNPN